MNIECPPGQTECYDEKCYDLTSDNLNCGRCGNICPAYSGCTDSVCVAMDDEDILMFVVEYH
jgi:Stigma-specific protein, Stig1